MSNSAATEPPVCPPGYVIRERLPGDDAQLVAVENAACLLFAEHGYPELAENGFPDVASFREMMADGTVFVAARADGVPVGYAVAIGLGDWSHLRELSVHPNYGRKGLGRALVRTLIAAAQNMGAAGVSLSTFRAVPFNKPFYESIGFHELPPVDAPLPLAEAFRCEVPEGVDPRERVLMVLPLLPPGKP